MPPVGAERWFHTLVVVGASLTGCGEVTSDEAMPTTSGSGGASSSGGTASGGLGGAAWPDPDMCAYSGQFLCDDYATRTNCTCNTTAPHEMSDCASPLDYQCASVLPCRAPPGVICFGERHVGCRCDPSGPRPSDCATPEQFFCNIVRPVFADCRCLPDAPHTSCREPELVCCQSDDPQFGCSCSCAYIR